MDDYRWFDFLGSDGILFAVENQQIIQQIENLKGRRSYEEQRAAKLGFAPLYTYFEHKHQKSALAAEASTAQLERLKIEKEQALKAKAEKKKGCGCC